MTVSLAHYLAVGAITIAGTRREARA